MAEIKNNFVSSRMNQDIDDRLMPNNEYRYALNLEVNRSEASDVGTLQNILGNSLAVDFRSISGTNNIECVGVLADDSNNNIYVFLTNNTGTAYNPSAKNYIYVYNNKLPTTFPSNPILLVTGEFLNFSTQYPIYGINLIENLLFWTDNRNQPRRINVAKANPQNTSVPTYYTIEEQISVAQLSPLGAPELFRESVLEPGEYETTMYDVYNQFLPNGTANPYYQENYPGDPVYLESKYVRFSYRYKFEDNEYSIMAPFTQIAYIPKQDGYFMYEPPVSPNTEPELDDETSAYRSTIVSFMQNKVNNILLEITLPYLPVPEIIPPALLPIYVSCPANELYLKYKIVEIEILYKEADDLAVKVIDSIPTIPDSGKGTILEPYFWNTTGTKYTYNYQSKKPFKTLPTSDTIRVYDATPVKALSQEVAGNRVIYGNYQDKFSYPKYLDYNAGYSAKLPFGFGSEEGTSIVEYPNHSIKENRNYQVGVVLCDKFGRQSGVILSDLIKGDDAGEFGASTLYVPYSGVNEFIPFEWPGNSLKILFNSIISPDNPDVVTGWPGLYNGDKTDPDYNPLGWYSYKIVVKQTEQDYYNVYLPGIMAAYPDNSTLELGKTSHAVLINDNINKVPRDLSEVGPGQKQFRSSVILYPRVDNNTEAWNNQQVDPGNTYSFVNTIATNNSLFFPNGIYPTSPPTGYSQFYQIDSDPLIARISTPSKLGVLASTSDVINLAVYETKPTESRLDIYWETSTTGLISDLNTAIQLSDPNNIKYLSGWSFLLTEAMDPGDTVTDEFVFLDILSDEITPTNVTIESVVTLTGTNVTNKFSIENVPATNKYIIKTEEGLTPPPSPAYFYYGTNAVNAESYIFTIKASIGSPAVSKTFIQTGSLTNIAPTITKKPTETIVKNEGDIDVYDFNGVNGSNLAGGRSTEGLTWSVTGDPIFSIDSNGIMQNLDGTAEGDYVLEVTLKDAGNLTDTVIVNVSYPLRQSFIVDGVDFACMDSTGSAVSYFGYIEVIGNGWEVRAYINADVGTYSAQTDLGIYSDETDFVVITQVSATGGNEAYSVWYSLTPGTYTYDLLLNGNQGGGCGGFFYRNV